MSNTPVNSTDAHVTTLATTPATAPNAMATGIDAAVADGGAYDVLRKRLTAQGARLRNAANAINAQRVAQFGGQAMEVIGRVRVRTEHNCIARDIVQVGDLLLFGYNVFIGLKSETRIADVFSLQRLSGEGDALEAVPVEIAGSFLDAPAFANDFRELYAYYKHTRLLQLTVRNGQLLAAFQIGERLADVRVFRWSVSPDGRTVRYVDNRGERDLDPPPSFDFEWTRAGREQLVQGRYPHLNILDTVFVDTIGGDLTIKVEDNTEDGLGVYREPVEDATQSLDDAQVDYARVGAFVLLRVLPYRETTWRHFVFNTLDNKVHRIDAIGQACVQLPDDHGIVFPGGYLLPSGESKAFEQPTVGMQFERVVRSPNGEDVLYVFYEPVDGRSALFTYNMIERALRTPIFGHGWALLADGRLVVFTAEAEPTRTHPMQVWQTAFASDEHAAAQPPPTGPLGVIGNAEVVRGVSDLLSLVREIESGDVTAQRYVQLVRNARRMFDVHHWIDTAAGGDTAPVVREIALTADAVLAEFEKVQAIRTQSERALAEARTRHAGMLQSLRPDDWTEVQPYVDALSAMATLRGHLLTIRELRHIDTAAIDAMEAELVDAQERIGAATGRFLAGDTALAPLAERIVALDAEAQDATTAAQLVDVTTRMQAVAADLDTLSALMAGLKVDDATQRTRVVDALSQLYAQVNQARARAEQRRKSLGSTEATAQFGAQFALFSQSIASALGLATTPERCDEQLARLLVQLEALESQFGEHEQFLTDILAKREEMLEAFEAHRQSLVDDRQRKAQSVFEAATRILDSLPRRTARLVDAADLNAFFAGDALILKLRELGQRLRGLDDSVKADDIDARLKAARDQSVRGLRDRTELFEGDGNAIKLGPRHRFSVNTQELDITVLPRGDGLSLQLTGTDFAEALHDPALDALKPYWQATLESESDALTRAEYLLGEVLDAARAHREGLSPERLRELALQPTQLEDAVRAFATPRYRDGYEKGLHDHDTARLLQAALPLLDRAGLLAHGPSPRALALLAWSVLQHDADAARWPARARAARDIAEVFGHDAAVQSLGTDVAAALVAFRGAQALAIDLAHVAGAAAYLVDALSVEPPAFATTRSAAQLVDALRGRLTEARTWDAFERALAQAEEPLGTRWALATHWLDGLLRDPAHAGLARFRDEAAMQLVVGDSLPLRASEIDLQLDVEGLLAAHARVIDGRMAFAIDDWSDRLRRHREVYVPGVRAFQAARHAVVETQRANLRLDEFKPRPLSTFVRNKLINDVYLPVIGDNLAKQIGTVGEAKRSDLMGLLMMISPPGYGKTTLLEYVAHRLGLIFMRINGPALGHSVRSLDPAQAPDANARQELHKLNLALEMGNNVMLYLDDIQHTHPEFLQKFISLCDATRRIEGVWHGRTRTYDMRGKKFCVVMAGNPYTESGEVFRIPDMLANRADVYNLGDVLGGMEGTFKLSYIENSLTSNPVLAPLATRDLADLYAFVDKVEGRAFSANALAHAYGSAEIEEITTTLARVMQVRDVVYAVNQRYIASAGQDDRYRTEPAFKLQGSYRNMGKLAEKISAAMNEAELQQLIADHYQGEAQLLTTGAEANLLKLGELRGTLDAAQQARWAQIKADFLRNKAMGSDDADVGGRVVAQLADLVTGVRALDAPKPVIEPKSNVDAYWSQLLPLLERVAAQRTNEAPTPSTEASRADAPAFGPVDLAAALQAAFQPLIEAMAQRDDRQAQLQQALIEAIANTRKTVAPGAPVSTALFTADQERLHRALSDIADRLDDRTQR